MTVTTCDLVTFQAHLQEWSGGAVSLNSFRDEHDRLILRLEHPTGSEQPVGLSLFYCTYLAGPVKWRQSALVIRNRHPEDAMVGYEIVDEAAGFVAHCASASLYGEPEIVLPEQV